MAVRPSHPAPPAYPRQSLDGKVEDIARELATKVERNTEPVFPSIILRSPNGTHWRVKVNDAGALAVTVVPRT